METELVAFCQQIAGLKRRSEEVEVFAARGLQTEVEVRADGSQVPSESLVTGVAVTVVAGERAGFAWANSFDAADVATAFEHARRNAALVDPDEHVALATPADVGPEAPPGLELWSDRVLETPLEDKVAFIVDAARRTRHTPGIYGLHSALYEDAAVETALANSLGVVAHSRRTIALARCRALAARGTEIRAGSGVVAGRAMECLDPDSLATMAAADASRLLGARRPSPGTTTVLFRPQVATVLQEIVATFASGSSAGFGGLTWGDRLGSRVASPAVTLQDDPTDPGALGASVFDADGVPCRRSTFIRDGVFVLHADSVGSARGAGRTTTGNAIRSGFQTPSRVGFHSLRLVGGTRPVDDLVSGMATGIVVDNLYGLDPDLVLRTGNLVASAEGHLVRHGSPAEPVDGFSVRIPIRDLLAQVLEVSNDRVPVESGAVGCAVLVEGLSIDPFPCEGAQPHP